MNVRKYNPGIPSQPPLSIGALQSSLYWDVVRMLDTPRVDHTLTNSIIDLYRVDWQQTVARGYIETTGNG